MKWLLTVLVFFLASCSAFNEVDPLLKSQPVPFVVDQNTVQLIGDLTPTSAGAELSKIRAASPQARLYVVLQTAGGDLDFVKDLASALREKNAACYARAVAGTGVSLLASCKVRLADRKSMVYARRITANFTNVTSDVAETYTAKLKDYEDFFTGHEAERAGLSLSAYLEQLGKTGKFYRGLDEILGSNQADGEVKIDCSKVEGQSLTRQYPLPGVPGLPEGAALTLNFSACPEPRALLAPSVPKAALDFFGIVVDSDNAPADDAMQGSPL